MRIGDCIVEDFKGITPQYTNESDTIVLNQKCIRNGFLSYDESQFVSDEQSISSNKYLKKGDIVICSTGQGTAGRCAFITELPDNKKVTIDSHILVCRCNDWNTAQALANIIISQEKMIMTFLTGSSGQGELDKIRVFDLEVVIPQGKELEKAVKLFENMDKHILNTSNIEKQIDELIMEIYKFWFVQFDFPNSSGDPYRKNNGLFSFSEKLNQDIPDGWRTYKLKKYILENNSGDWGKEKEEGNYKLKVSCIRGADLVAMRDLPERYILLKNSSKLLKEGDIVVEISGGSPIQATGRSTIITEALLDRFDKSIICSNFCQSLKIKDPIYSAYFYYTWNLFYENGVMFNYEGKTSGIKNLIIDALLENYWYFPPKEIAESFSNVVITLLNAKDRAASENIRLFDLKNELLLLVTSGQAIY